MGNNTYNLIPNIILLAALSTSVVSLSYTYDSLIPLQNHQYSYQNDISDWKDFAFHPSSDYQQISPNNQSIKTIIEFSRTVIENSKDIDSEYVDIVNANFWELI
jgi:hypothetical protein